MANLQRVLAFVEATYFSQSITELLYKSTEYFMRTFKLNNCAMQLYDTHHRAITNGLISSHYREIESRIGPIVADRKTPYYISPNSPDATSTHLRYLQAHLCAYPVMIKNELIGTLYLYSAHALHDEQELIEALLERLTRVTTHIKGYAEVKHSAMTDPMTGLYNKAYFSDAATRTLLTSKDKQPTSIVIIDLDNFKQYNDTQGHIAGDALLKKLAQVIRDTANETHISARFGGEEFVILLPNTAAPAAHAWAEQLRANIETHTHSTASIGVATCKHSKSTYSTLLKLADDSMYESKRAGKNRVRQQVVLDPSLSPVAYLG